MKIEKTTKNTLKISISIEELSAKNITIKDIENGKKKAQNFFFDIIDDSIYAEDFLKDNNKLLVEASIARNNTLIVTITKLEELPEIAKDVFPKKHNLKVPPSTLYLFPNLSALNEFVRQVKFQKLFVGTNNLYKYNNIYFITFPLRIAKDLSFKKTHITLTEYCNTHLSKNLNICALKENSELLISKCAIDTIASHILQ